MAEQLAMAEESAMAEPEARHGHSPSSVSPLALAMAHARLSPRSPLQLQQQQQRRPGAALMLSHPHTFVISALALIALLFLTVRPGSSSLSAISTSPQQERIARPRFPVYSNLLKPRRELLNGTEFVYQVPANPRAVLFLAHGCYCRATFFWDKHPECATCSGAPEERAFVIKALRASYAVISITSREDCWRKADSPRVKFVLESWIDRFGLVELPLLGLGASSGGYFLSRFANIVKFDAIVVMIAEGSFHTVPNSSYPPVLFVHMVKDETRAERIREIMPVLRKAGIDANEIQCKEANITADFFSKRIPYVDLEMSVKLGELLERCGYLDGRRLLKMDSRSLRLKQDMRRSKDGLELLDSLSWRSDHWEHHIREELNLAFAFHEFTSLPTRKIIAWFESHVKMPPNVTRIY